MDVSDDATKNRLVEGRRRAGNPIPPELRSLIGEANEKLVFGDFKGATEKAMEVIRLSPALIDPYFILAMCYEESQNLEKSAEFYMITAYLRYRDIGMWRRLAEIYTELNILERAAYCFTKVIRLDPTDIEALHHRTMAYNIMGDKKKEIEGYILLNKKSPAELEWYKELGRLYHETDQIDKAQEILEQGFESIKETEGKTDYELYYQIELINMLAELYISNRKFAEAIRLFEWLGLGTMEAESFPMDIISNYGICKLNVGEMEEGDVYLNYLKSSDINLYHELFFNAGNSYAEVGEYRKALDFYEALLALESYNQVVLWDKMAKCYYHVQRFEEAIQYYKMVLEVSPGNVETCIALSQLYVERNELDNAMSTIDHFMDVSNEEGDKVYVHPKVLAQKAQLLFSIKQYEEFADITVKLLRDPYLVFSMAKRRVVGLHLFQDEETEWLPVIQKKDKKKKEEEAMEVEGETPKKEDNIVVVLGQDLYMTLMLNTCHVLEYLSRHTEALSFFKTSYMFILNDDVIEISHDMKDYLKYLGAKISYQAEQYDVADQFLRSLCSIYPKNIVLWNFLYRVIHKTGMFHLSAKFLHRMVSRHPDNVPLRILNGNSFYMSSSFKIALTEYFPAYQRSPKSPILNLLMGLTYLNLSMSRRTPDRHLSIMQAFAFLNQYYDLTERSQEATYNLARAFHQLNLTNFAIPLYEEVLEKEWPPVKTLDANHSYVGHLKREAAYNLALIYRQSGGSFKAIDILKKHLVI